jgi:hypothetical protein
MTLSIINSLKANLRMGLGLAISLTILNLIALKANGQTTQQIRGRITDKTSERTIAGVTVRMEGSKIAATTDSLGRYTLTGVPTGRQKITFSSTGYDEVVIPDVLVTSGKEVILEVALEQSFTTLQQVTVSASRTVKGNASNEYAGSSSRSFSMEEVTRYAGGRNDPARLASNFAGVSTTDDSRNDIVVRGNSPSGVLWRMEGIPIPNPNHFATFGTTGGSVSAVNTNALRNSDFYTGAFSAEYGNASAAVFDLSLRPGNKRKFEKTIQLNLFSGLEAMLEGPLGKKDGSSFMIGYRYSFAQIGQSMGFNVGTTAPPRYQDLTFNLDFKKNKAGKFNIFGVIGNSSIDFIGADIEPEDLFANQDEDLYVKSRLAVVGVKHQLEFGKNTYLRSVLSYSSTNFSADQFKYYDSLTERQPLLEQDNTTNTLRFSTFVNSKISNRMSIRSGILLENATLDAFLQERLNRPDWEVRRNYDDNSMLVQPFAQGRYRFTEKLSFTAGVHGLFYNFNQSSSIEPRASLSYQLKARNTVTLSYGLHSQLQPMPVYLFQRELADGSYDQSNRDLGLSKAHHYILGYEWRAKRDWRIKTEIYYQSLYNIPVERLPSGFSVINAGADFGFPEKSQLVNDGTGYNTGLELTIERFFSRGFYILGTASFFNSKYKGSDNIERNSTFNNRFVGNLLVGREWAIGGKKQNVFTIDLKVASSGGRYYTPVDLDASIRQNTEVLDETRYNADRLPSYFRTDLRFGFRKNSTRKNLSHTFYLDFQNISANENIFTRRYNQVLKTVGDVNQIGFFPDILYRLQF